MHYIHHRYYLTVLVMLNIIGVLYYCSCAPVFSYCSLSVALIVAAQETGAEIQFPQHDMTSNIALCPLNQDDNVSNLI